MCKPATEDAGQNSRLCTHAACLCRIYDKLAPYVKDSDRESILGKLQVRPTSCALRISFESPCHTLLIPFLFIHKRVHLPFFLESGLRMSS